LISWRERTFCAAPEDSEEPTGNPVSAIEIVGDPGELDDSVAEPVIMAQLKSPVGLLTTGGVKDFRITTSHNRYARCGRRRPLAHTTTPTAKATELVCQI
jgi:hypothetical protein